MFVGRNDGCISHIMKMVLSAYLDFKIFIFEYFDFEVFSQSHVSGCSRMYMK